MSEINDGGPAFPQTTPGKMVSMGPNGSVHTVMETTGGMSLRDWFAGQALAGIEAAFDEGGKYESWVAEGCYRMADAMLAERAKAVKT